MIGAAYSTFLLVPWFRLVVGLIAQREPGFVGPVYILLYSAWFIGPIVFWGQYVANIEALQTLGIGSVSYDEAFTLVDMATYGVFAAMSLTWIASMVMSLRTPANMVHPPVMSFRYIMPFVLASGCTLFVYGYLFVYGRGSD